MFVILLLTTMDKVNYNSFEMPKGISILVPCYNSFSTVGGTIKSVVSTMEHLKIQYELIVVDDASTDATPELLKSLRRKYSFKLVRNKKNLGKAKSLNKYSKKARFDLLFFVDSDIVLNEAVVIDMISRLNNKKVGAVSSQCIPLNRGFMALMQFMEYNMLSLIQSSYNISSALVLGGGSILVKKKAFEQVKGFSVNAVTEDVDLSFKLNRAGYKVQLSSFRVGSYVPTTLADWIKQKSRWAVGNAQCIIRYPKVWGKNLIHLLITALYVSVSLIVLINILLQASLLHYLFTFMPGVIILYIKFLVKTNVFYLGVNALISSLFFVPYAYPIFQATKRFSSFLWVFPFSLIYLPIFGLVSTGAVLLSLRKIFYLNREAKVRAW